MSPPRILRLTPFYHHERAGEWPARYDPVGGMQVQTWRISEWLSKRGMRQLVLTLGFPGLQEKLSSSDRLTVRQCRLWLPEWRSETTGIYGLVPSWFIAVILHCLRLRGRSDLVHVHADGQIYALLAALLVPRLLGLPCVLTLHCSRIASHRPVSKWDALQHSWIVRMERCAVRKVARVLVLTERTRASILGATGVPPERVEVMPDVLDSEAFWGKGTAGASEAFASRHGVPLERRIVAFVGRIAPEKGWPDLIDLAEALPDIHILVIGDGPQRDRMTQLLEERGLSRRFTITGFLSHGEVAHAIRAASLVVMPSRHEEFGGVALEALCVGRPVVAYGVGGIRDTIGRFAPEWLARSGDVGELIARVRTVLAKPRPDVLLQGRAWVDGAFHPDRVLARLLDVYAELADSNRSQPCGRHGRGSTGDRAR